MKHLPALFLVFAAATVTGPACAKETPEKSPIRLSRNVEISERLVRLGDLFTGLEEKAAVPVSHAPAPGKKTVFDADWLYRVAHKYGISWKPSSRYEQVTVSRLSQRIDAQRIRDELRRALSDKGIKDTAELQLQDNNLNFHVDQDSTPEVNVEILSLDRRYHSFSAQLTIQSENSAPIRRRLSGRVYETVSVPVPTRYINRGERVREQDLEWTTLRADRLQRNSITAMDELAGMEARRSLRPEKPVKSHDICRPVLVEKGSVVTMRLKSSGLSLTTAGKALENGSKNDVIRIRNVKSKQTVLGRVRSHNSVTVSPDQSVAMK